MGRQLGELPARVYQWRVRERSVRGRSPGRRTRRPAALRQQDTDRPAKLRRATRCGGREAGEGARASPRGIFKKQSNSVRAYSRAAERERKTDSRRCFSRGAARYSLFRFQRVDQTRCSFSCASAFSVTSQFRADGITGFQCVATL